MSKPKPVTPVAHDVRILASFRCSRCNETHVAEITYFYTSGGCTGHGPEEYCYCGSPEVRGDTKCPRCEASFDILVRESSY